VGEHLVCSPCGKVTRCNVGINGSDPEVLLSRLQN
jgi:hypothetical protein